MCRIAVAEGISAEDVLVMASLHAARGHGLLDRGAIAPGYLADLVLLDDLDVLPASLVVKDGRVPEDRRGPGRAARHDALGPVSFGIPGLRSGCA